MTKDGNEHLPLGRIGDIARKISEYSKNSDIANLVTTSKSNRDLYQQILDEGRALEFVLHGNPDSLAALIKRNPELLFLKGTVSLEREYGLVVIDKSFHFTSAIPNQLYLKTLEDKSLSYTLCLRNNHNINREDYIRASISKEELFKVGIRHLPNPLTEAFVEKHIKPKLSSILKITTQRGHTTPEITYYNVSPYQLMTFLCDEKMKDDILHLVMPLSEELQLKRQKQYSEIARGGADLAKINVDPSELAFENVIRYTSSFNVRDFRSDYAIDMTFPLLENPDGIISYWNELTRQRCYYYVNQKERTVSLIEPIAGIEDEIGELERLHNLFVYGIYENSARRSSDEEHALIKKTLGISLHREGIEYVQEGIKFRDTRADFNRIFATYRDCLEIQRTRHCNMDYAWLEVGLVQRKVMWLLQRICENKSIRSISEVKTSPFERSFKVMDRTKGYSNRSPLSVFSYHNGLVSTLGYKFAILKGEAINTIRGNIGEGKLPENVTEDLRLINLLVASGKAAVNENELDENLQAGLSF